MAPTFADPAAQRKKQLLLGLLDFTARQPWAGRLDTPLKQLRAEVAEQLGLTARTVAGEAAFLVEWLDFVTRQYWVPDLAEEAHGLLGAVRAATGTAESNVPAGTPGGERDDRASVQGLASGTRGRGVDRVPALPAPVAPAALG